MPLKRDETVERRAEKVKGGSGDERSQNKVKTPRKMIEARTPAAK